jgi:D-glycero-D-manno-heptose 1,7-bisphosphate phosphatase
MNKAVFLDRDGVINRKAREGEYVTRWEEIEILPGVADAIALLNRARFKVIVVTNQRCIAKGIATAREVETLHQRLCNELAAHGATIDDIYYCPHEAQPPCLCRKPAPGMILNAARDHGIALERSWMIGDSESDMATGKRAGCRTVGLRNDKAPTLDADLISDSLLDAVHKILQEDLLEYPTAQTSAHS